VKTHIGQKVSFNLPDGRSVPGIVLSDESTTPTEVTNRTTGAKITVAVTRVDVISQRTSREGVTYRTISSEVVQYGYAPKMLPRFNAIVGLDATADGEKITLQQAIDSVATDREAFLNGLYTARHEIVSADAV
jgi:hypothetical protein